MPKKKLPYIGNTTLRQISHMFLGVGAILYQLTPYLEMTLKQSGVASDYKLNARKYLSIVAVVVLINGIASFLIVTCLLYLGGQTDPTIGILSGALFGSGTYFYMLMLPKSIVNTRVKYLERNLLYALRSILIQLRSGVPIFNTLVSIANGDYGPISDEFKNVVEKVNSGTPMVEVLEELAIRNPSIYFRRALWQLVNSMKSGSNIADNIDDVIRSLSKEQLIEVRQYKSTLNPLAMMYMMIAVIMPSLGITILIILSTFPGMESVGNEQTFWILFASIVVLQFIFMGLIKSKRPNLIGN